MLISHRYSFIFIHVPKTGGTALSQALAPYARTEDRLAYQVSALPVARRLLPPLFGGRKKYIENITGFRAHTAYRKVLKVLDPERVRNLKSFAFIRNPFTRAYSQVSHIMRLPFHPDHEKIKGLSFEKALPILLEESAMKQSKYFTLESRQDVAVDFLGSLESFNEDSEALQAWLGLPKPLALRKVNVSPDRAPDLRKAYGSALEQFIEIQAKEFELLGYSKNIDDAFAPPEKRILPT